MLDQFAGHGARASRIMSPAPRGMPHVHWLQPPHDSIANLLLLLLASASSSPSSPSFACYITASPSPIHSTQLNTTNHQQQQQQEKEEEASYQQQQEQEEEMAPSFGRSISFPLSPARSKPRSSAACHVRSISLPCRSHPLLSHLQSHIAAVRSWLIHDASSVAAGLAHIHALHSALADLLLLPDPQDTLRRATAAADRLLDAFLLLADAHRTFQEVLLDLRQDVAEARAALRRGDAARLAASVRSQKKAEKELARLASTVNSGGRCTPSSRLGLGGATAEETEMAAALIDAAAASAAASSAVFATAASMSSAAASSCKKTPAFAAFAKKASPETAEVALDKFEELEQCIDESESSCHKVFRSILQTRVALLNIQTPTF